MIFQHEPPLAPGNGSPLVHRRSVATRRMSVSEGWNCRPGALFYILVTGFFLFYGDADVQFHVKRFTVDFTVEIKTTAIVNFVVRL